MAQPCLLVETIATEIVYAVLLKSFLSPFEKFSLGQQTGSGSYPKGFFLKSRLN